MTSNMEKAALILFVVLTVCNSDDFQRRRVFYNGGDYACMAGWPAQLDKFKVTLEMVG